MPQTYDMIGLVSKPAEGLNLTAGYVSKVNKIFANECANNGYKEKCRTLDTNSVILNGSYALAPAFKLTGYGYMLASVHDTFGIRATGEIDLGLKISYEAEYAAQNKASLEEDSYGKSEHDADYYKLGFRLKHSGFIFGADYEVLGKEEVKGGGAFGTPLATAHAMNGWADHFLATPVDGLVDTAITLGYINKSFGRFIIIYRDFESDGGSKDYGKETDVIYAHKLSKNLGMIVKAAFYKQGDDLSKADTTKYWAMLDYKFGF